MVISVGVKVVNVYLIKYLISEFSDLHTKFGYSYCIVCIVKLIAIIVYYQYIGT